MAGPTLPRVRALRYVTPLREGGSLPAVMEADDCGTYVVKFRGAGQGVKVLVAEIVTTEIARTLGIPTPELAIVFLDDAMTKYERDEEVQDLLRASVGTNLGSDFLPGSFGYDGSTPPAADLAARIVWLDAYTLNVDRTWANPNLVVWHGRTHAIDHGASLWFHHAWARKAPQRAAFATRPFDATTHVLADVAAPVEDVGSALAARLTDDVLGGILDLVPDEWLEPTADLVDPAAVREEYLGHLTARRDAAPVWVRSLT
ncbi:aminotransferase class I and II [Nostocoides sp. F2B08]|uniref:HipA family kinase n=1 Tax=Nostocoides sp. F2B08 TaxID=2653936 RepID=UPI001263E59A|nr:HipA family kinase [Tetrasphaera sp. F2B08]KAB7744503.1 aminotransferase class I and II [Tetrasphaera sp. F2B08]